MMNPCVALVCRAEVSNRIQTTAKQKSVSQIQSPSTDIGLGSWFNCALMVNAGLSKQVQPQTARLQVNIM